VEAIERPHVAIHDTGISEDGVDVERRVVVGVERTTKIPEYTRGAEVVGGSED